MTHAEAQAEVCATLTVTGSLCEGGFPLQPTCRRIHRVYFERKLAAGKSPAEARRCLKRHIANTIYRHLRDDAKLAR
jgi:hypothetical protein